MFSLWLPGYRGIGHVVDSRDMQSNVMNLRTLPGLSVWDSRWNFDGYTDGGNRRDQRDCYEWNWNGFSLMMAQWSQGSLVIAILLIRLASLVLGMGLR